MKINLLEETEQILEQHNLGWRNVKFIANAEGIVNIATFVALAKMYYYDNTEKNLGVDPSIVIVGSTWWMTRIVLDGEEKWFFHKKPQKPTLNSIDFSIKGRFYLNPRE